MQSANSHQEGGDHYAALYQHWDFVCECLAGRYLEGNLTKYVARWRKKNGLQDIQKAIHYYQKIRELFVRGDLAAPPAPGRRGAIDCFCVINELGSLETRVMRLAATWKGAEDLDSLKEHLLQLEIKARS